MALIMPPEAFELSAWAQRVGADDPMPYLKDLALIDTEAIREVGLTVWGGHEPRENPVRTPDGGPSLARVDLEDEAAELRKQLYRELSPDWNDNGYAAFEQHVEGFTESMTLTASHFSEVGDVLIGIADEFEMRWLEVVGIVVSTVGLIVAAVGFVIAATTWWTGGGGVAGVIVGAIGVIIAAIGWSVAYLNAALPRLEALAEATERLNEAAPPVARWVEPE